MAVGSGRATSSAENCSAFSAAPERQAATNAASRRGANDRRVAQLDLGRSEIATVVQRQKETIRRSKA